MLIMVDWDVLNEAVSYHRLHDSFHNPSIDLRHLYYLRGPRATDLLTFHDLEFDQHTGNVNSHETTIERYRSLHDRRIE